MIMTKWLDLTKIQHRYFQVITSDIVSDENQPSFIHYTCANPDGKLEFKKKKLLTVIYILGFVSGGDNRLFLALVLYTYIYIHISTYLKRKGGMRVRFNGLNIVQGHC